jgi:hypothetical protein
VNRSTEAVDNVGITIQTKKPLTLRELRDRLTEIIQEHDAVPRFAGRNEMPVYVRIEQPKTPTGRLRRDKFVPVHFGGSSLVGFRTDESAERIDAICLIASRLQGGGW